MASPVSGAEAGTIIGPVAGWVGNTEHREKIRTKVSQLANMEIVPFTQVLDKGYRFSEKNKKCGGQVTVQPIFAKSDHKFGGRDTIYSGSVASLRSGNERFVNVSKRALFIKRGFDVRSDPKVFDDVWLCWSFQANFMYDPVS